MRTIDRTTTVRDKETTAASIAADLHDMIAGYRCAGTGRLVKSGVSMTHMHVMWLLQHHGDLHMSKLAELLDVSMSSATGIVDRMEERGLVDRGRVADDRRVVEVHLSESGAEALEAIEALKQDRLHAVLGHLATPQLERVAAAIADIRSAVEAEFGPDVGAGHAHAHRSATEERV